MEQLKMTNAEALQANFRSLEAVWQAPKKGGEAAFQRSVRRLEKGETLKFVYHEFSHREPVDRIIFASGATGQLALPLYGEPLIWVQKKKPVTT